MKTEVKYDGRKIEVVGRPGYSTYQLWLQAGNTGSLASFLETIKGDSVYDTWLSAGNTGSVDDFLASQKGTNGANGITMFQSHSDANNLTTPALVFILSDETLYFFDGIRKRKINLLSTELPFVFPLTLT